MSVLKNIMLFGVGLVSVTREKAEEIVEEMISRGEVANADRAKVIDEIQQKAQSAVAEVRKIVDERVETVGKKLRWIDDLRRLQTEVADLRARVEAVEKAPKTTTTKKSKSQSE
jgi:polyhydroxyalkanoate synthesis regulator phasin